MQEFDLVVVGAGIVGASVAWHAAQRGVRVAVVDGIGPAAGASGASDGAVSVASKREGILADVAYESLEYSKELAKKNGPLAGIFHARPSFFVATDEAEEGGSGCVSYQVAKAWESSKGGCRSSKPKGCCPRFWIRRSATPEVGRRRPYVGIWRYTSLFACIRSRIFLARCSHRYRGGGFECHCAMPVWET